MRTPVIAGNWKMNLPTSDATALARALRGSLAAVENVEVVLCPAFPVLAAVHEVLVRSGIGLGGQNCYHEERGAYTGEVAPQMLIDVGCEWVIIGHSERRALFGESDELLNKKLQFAQASGLNVMFCIGETLEQREAGETEPVLTRQLEGGFKDISEEALASIVIAYEPVWAIGTGLTATTEQAQEAHAHIRRVIADRFGAGPADAMRIQYGGSVKPDNARELLAQPDVDGALVGGASLEARSFTDIVKAAAVG